MSWSDGGGGGWGASKWSNAWGNAPKAPSPAPSAPTQGGVTNIAQQGSPGGWGAAKGSPGGQVTYGGSGGGTYTSPTGQQITQKQAQVLGIVDAPGDVAAKAAQIGLTPESAFKQGAAIPALVEMKTTPIPEVTQSRIEAVAQGVKLSPDIQAQTEKIIAQQKAVEQAILPSTPAPSVVTPDVRNVLSLPSFTELGYGGHTVAPAIGAPILAGLIAGGRQDYTGGLTISPEVVGAMAKVRQDVQEQRNIAEFAKYSTGEKAGAVLGMDPSAIINLYASRSTVLGQPLAGKEIISIPKGWVGGEKDWTFRVPTKEEAEKAYTKTKAETVQELKDIQASKETSALFGLVPLTGTGAKAYRSVQYGATWLPSEAVATYGAGALLGAAIPMAGAVTRIGVGKVATKLASTEAKGVGAKAVETVVKKVAVPFAENAEALMNIAGAGIVVGQVKKAGQAPGGLTIGTAAYEGAKLATAYKGFQKTYEPTMGALKGIETLPKGGKPIAAVEKEMAGLKPEKGTFGFTGEAPRSTMFEPSTGKRITAIDKEIASQSRWTGEGKAPSDYPKAPGRFGFSRLIPESFGKMPETPSTRLVRTSEYGYGQEVIPNPFEGFGGVSKTIVGIGKGVAQRGELPVPDFGSGLLQNYMGTELQIKDLNVFRPEISPKIDMFGNIKEGKHEVEITQPVWTGSELLTREGYKYRYREPTKPTEGYPTKPEYPIENPILYPVITPPVNIDENIFREDYIYPTKRGELPPPPTPGAGILLPPKLGGGGGYGMSFERVGKSLQEHKLTDPTSLFTGGTVFERGSRAPAQTGMMTLNIKAKQATPTNAGKIAKSMFELNIQQEKVTKASRTIAPKTPKAQTTSGNFLSLDLPMKKASKRRKNK